MLSLKDNNIKTKIPRSINLVGYPKNSLNELTKSLDILDITVNKIILPEIKSDDFDDYLSAHVQVLYPNILYDNIYNMIFHKIKCPILEISTPYGFRLTIDWIKKISNHFDINLDDSEEWNNYFMNLKIQYDNLSIHADKFTLGLVFSPNDLKYILNPKYFLNSIPLIKFLEDMGFKLDILIYSTKRDYIEYRKKLIDLMHYKDKHLVSYCTDDDEMDLWLNKKTINAIFSDYKYDRRISFHGKNRFSLSVNFERGFEGAIRTLKRLLHICSFRFNNTYANFFNYPYKPVRGDFLCPMSVKTKVLIK